MLLQVPDAGLPAVGLYEGVQRSVRQLGLQRGEHMSKSMMGDDPIDACMHECRTSMSTACLEDIS